MTYHIHLLHHAMVPSKKSTITPRSRLIWTFWKDTKSSQGKSLKWASPYGHMASMLVMHPSHRIDVLKMEPVFHVNDREKNKVFYISPRKWQGHKYSNEMYEVGWNDHYKLENKKVEDFLQTNPNLQKMSKYIYIYIYIYIFGWGGNYCLYCMGPLRWMFLAHIGGLDSSWNNYWTPGVIDHYDWS